MGIESGLTNNENVVVPNAFQIAQLPNWTIFSCSWLDEIYNIQVSF